ncbi:hypothetical protein [Pantoea allii]|uniref:hypothetical protein n=1 Tax=Pantoea allii TaxID=574096 RepID=UPI000FFC418D|nr:hypothetical protein [Pantoea allii]MBW1253551.1 hypothetical protein [Pantoea allii]MBW1260749.1 hypothetical protein [Pantoea allii]MBW1284791.1 hypothetical protein [Pantoea allii]
MCLSRQSHCHGIASPGVTRAYRQPLFTPFPITRNHDAQHSVLHVGYRPFRCCLQVAGGLSGQVKP